MTFGQFTAKWETEILVHYRASTKRFYKGDTQPLDSPLLQGLEAE